MTIVIRGGAAQYIEEAARSLNDAIMIVMRAIKTHAVVAGGGVNIVPVFSDATAWRIG